MNSHEEKKPEPKKPYHAPKLEYLGRVTDLTLGTATNGGHDAKSTGRKGA